MKITNWCRKVSATLVACGLLAPAAASWAVDVPLEDASFEDFNVTPHGGSAYANLYGNTSAWIADPGAGFHFGGPHAANWLYNSQFAADPNLPVGYGRDRQAAPRTGNQAMHGRFQYSGQVTDGVFEAGMTYRFSIYSQGNEHAEIFSPFGWQSRVWLYLYNGSNNFSEPTSLTYARYAPTEPPPGSAGDFINRPVGTTQLQSRLSWTKISIDWTVQPGAPEIGHPVGVAFYLGDHAAVDDASLEFFPTTGKPLELRINRETGNMSLQNNSGAPLNLSGYQITSSFGSLTPSTWHSITDFYDAGSPGVDQVDSAHNWNELTAASAHNNLSEADLESGHGAMIANLKTINLGETWIKTPKEDLVFQYVSDGVVKQGKVIFENNFGHCYYPGDFNTNGIIDVTDWNILRSNQHRDMAAFSLAEAYRLGDMTGDGKSNHADFAAFKSEYEALNGLGSFQAMLESVPEPTTFVLTTMAGLAMISLRRRLG